MYLSLLTLPLTTFACIGLFGRYIGARGTIVLSVFSAIICALISMLIFYEVALCRTPCQINLAPYFHSELFDANWGFLFDTLTAVMCVVVTLISCLVIIYSCSYMVEDPHFIRFISYLKLFTVSMLVLVTADNYIQLFVGWEAVGLASFLLISFWFNRLQASKAAIQAMLLNRVGDVALALGIICLFFGYKTTHYQALFACATDFYGLNFVQIAGSRLFHEPLALLDFACVLLFIGAAGKSGQFGQKGPKKVSSEWFTPFQKCYFLESRYMLETSLKTLNPLQKNCESLFIKKPNWQLEKFQTYESNQQENQRNKFTEWFIGFVEGDGCFYITEGKPIFSIHLHIVDLPLLYNIQSFLQKKGSVSFNKESKKALLTIKAKKEILFLINIFNGNLFLRKRKDQFKLWIEAYNKKYHFNMKVIKSQFLPSLNNGWVSGFTDAEGSFVLVTTKT